MGAASLTPLSSFLTSCFFFLWVHLFLLTYAHRLHSDPGLLMFESDNFPPCLILGRKAKQMYVFSLLEHASVSLAPLPMLRFVKFVF